MNLYEIIELGDEYLIRDKVVSLLREKDENVFNDVLDIAKGEDISKYYQVQRKMMEYTNEISFEIKKEVYHSCLIVFPFVVAKNENFINFPNLSKVETYIRNMFLDLGSYDVEKMNIMPAIFSGNNVEKMNIFEWFNLHKIHIKNLDKRKDLKNYNKNFNLKIETDYHLYFIVMSVHDIEKNDLPYFKNVENLDSDKIENILNDLNYYFYEETKHRCIFLPFGSLNQTIGGSLNFQQDLMINEFILDLSEDAKVFLIPYNNYYHLRMISVRNNYFNTLNINLLENKEYFYTRLKSNFIDFDIKNTYIFNRSYEKEEIMDIKVDNFGDFYKNRKVDIEKF